MLTFDVFVKVLNILPFFFFILISMKKNEPYRIQKISNMTSAVLLFMMAIFMGLTPIEQGADKYYYVQEFLGDTSERSNEVGWFIYNLVMAKLLGVNFVLFFIVTALIYSYSYYFIAKKYFPQEMVGYFVLLATGSLGFVNYGSNTIRAGFAIATIFYAVSLKLNKWQRGTLIILALLIHKSMFIPVSFYYIASLIRNKRFVELFWLLCLAISIINVDFESFFSGIGGWDDRIEQFTSGAIDQTDEYGARYRYDFLIYSIVPIYIANIWMGRFQYDDEFYSRIYRTYIMINAIWLIVIRMPFCDRIAYLSWFMIPIIVLYPVLTKGVQIKNVQRVLSLIIGLFIGVNVLLSLR